MKYKAVLMAVDGDFVTDYESKSVADVYKRANDAGSRWFFYPFIFVIRSDSQAAVPNRRVIDVGLSEFLNLEGKSIKTVQKFFADNQDAVVSLLS